MKTRAQPEKGGVKAGRRACTFALQANDTAHVPIPFGVLHGEEVSALFDDAQARGYALPAVNIIGTDSLATLETAAAVGSPVIVQLSNGGAAFYAGKSLKLDNQQAQVLGSVSAAHHVHELAAAYGVPCAPHGPLCPQAPSVD